MRSVAIDRSVTELIDIAKAMVLKRGTWSRLGMMPNDLMTDRVTEFDCFDGDNVLMRAGVHDGDVISFGNDPTKWQAQHSPDGWWHFRAE